MQLGLVSPTSSPALCQRGGKASPAAPVFYSLPDKPAEELHCDIKLSLHWHCCYCPAELNVKIINTPMDLATDTIKFKEITRYHSEIYVGTTMHLQA